MAVPIANSWESAWLISGKMGKPVPDSIYSETLRSASGKGLDLPKGPDSRSLNPEKARMARTMRGIFGLDAPDVQ